MEIAFRGMALASDMTMLASVTSPTTTPATSPTSMPIKTFAGPITRSRAKKIQHEVHVLLCEFQLNTLEDYCAT